MVKGIFSDGSGFLLMVLTRPRAVMAVIVVVVMQMRFVLTLDATAMHALETT